MRITTLLVSGFGVGLALALSPSTAGAEDLERACAAVGEATASCALERGGSSWTLTTSLLVGGGGKARVAEVEEMFCAQARRRGIPAQVVRWNRMPGSGAPAAKVEWTCGESDVASGPPTRRR